MDREGWKRLGELQEEKSDDSKTVNLKIYIG